MADLDRDETTQRAGDDASARPAAGGQPRATDWRTQDAFWRESFGARPYASADRGYADYRQAYKYGHEAAFTYGYRPWDDEVEHDLERGWKQARADSTLDWTQAKHAVRDAFERAREPG